MNCQQFENRIQQLLDQRALLGLDVQLQRHARQCRCCGFSLKLYQCISAPADINSAKLPVDQIESQLTQSSGVVLASQSNKSWHENQIRDLRIRGILAAAVLILICLPLVVDFASDSALSTAKLMDSRPEVPVDLTVAADAQGWPAWFPTGWNYDFSIQQWIPVSIREVSEIDLRSLSDINLVSFVPAEHVSAIRRLPNTIESMQPIYRYSTEFPMVHQFSSGINYTLGLIRTSLPGTGINQNSSADENSDATSDLGNYLSWGSSLLG